MSRTVVIKNRRVVSIGVAGRRGEKGDQGPKGDKGDQGDPATNLVQSVNGKQGTVVLTASDVAADPSGSASQALSDANDYTDQEVSNLESSLATVAKTGSYNDLTNKPTIPTVPVQSVNGRTGNVTGLAETSDVTAQLNTKVDKVAGKQLSTEDFTSAEKTKLSGIEAGAQVNTVTSVAGKTGVVTLTKGDVGLGNVDNTSDIDKPVSTAQAAADATKVSLTGNQTIAGTKTFSSALITQSGTSIGGVLHLTGSGQPNGVVPAPVGSKYIDTANTNGVLEWMKASGTGNTGWVVSVGDDTASKLYVQSRGQNLISNGTGLLGNNYNFSGFTFDPTEVYAGGGSFKSATYDAIIKTDELIPVDPNGQYELTAYAKATTYVVGARAYIGVEEYDIDGQPIRRQYYLKYPGSTDTTLASDLKSGDTKVYLTNATGWQNGGHAYQRQIAWYGYTNSKGYTYPDYTYTRNVSRTFAGYASNGMWAVGGVNGNEITLTEPWPGPTIVAGLAVRNTYEGGTYKYITAYVNIPNSWTRYSGRFGGVSVNGENADRKFSPATAFVKPVFLLNRDAAGNVTNISNVTFTKTGEDIVLTSPNGTLYRVNVSDAGVLSAGAV